MRSQLTATQISDSLCRTRTEKVKEVKFMMIVNFERILDCGYNKRKSKVLKSFLETVITLRL